MWQFLTQFFSYAALFCLAVLCSVDLKVATQNWRVQITPAHVWAMIILLIACSLFSCGLDRLGQDKPTVAPMAFFAVGSLQLITAIIVFCRHFKPKQVK